MLVVELNLAATTVEVLDRLAKRDREQSGPTLVGFVAPACRLIDVTVGAVVSMVKVPVEVYDGAESLPTVSLASTWTV